MSTTLSYIDDPLIVEFEKEVIHKDTIDNKNIALYFDETYFFPGGGGQEGDMGWIENVQVLRTIKDDQGNIGHVVDKNIEEKVVKVSIDWDRRLKNMQHHTAQHILTKCFDTYLGIKTTKVKIVSSSPSIIFLNSHGISVDDLERIEDSANQIVYKNLPVVSYITQEKNINRISSSKSQDLSDQIRVVEIGNFDQVACSGTHCTCTGMVGNISILGTKYKSGQLMVIFVAGKSGLDYFRKTRKVIDGATKILNVNFEEVGSAIKQQQEKLSELQNEFKKLSKEKLTLDAEKMIQQAEIFDHFKLILNFDRRKSIRDIRELGKLLSKHENILALLTAYDGKKLSLIVCCSQGININAKTLARRQLEKIQGKANGDSIFAHGGGIASESQLVDFFCDTKKILSELQSTDLV